MDNFREERLKNPSQFCIEVVSDTHGTFHYPNLDTTLSNPDLASISPEINGKEFTSGMYNGFCDTHKKYQMRFETWPVYNTLSI